MEQHRGDMLGTADRGGGRLEAWTLPPTPDSARAARRHVVELLGRDCDAEVAETVALLVSEVVTNAVLHAGTDIEVSARRARGAVRVDVRDGSPLLPTQRDYDSEAMTGRGLGLVEMLASDYGIDSLGGAGKVVWFVVGGSGADRASGWQVPATDNGSAAGGGRRYDVTLRGMPVALYRIVQEHNDALLREHALLRLDGAAATPESAAEVAAAERAHGRLTAAVCAAIEAAPTRDAIDVSLTLGAEDVADFSRLADVLEAAENLAGQGRLLTRPALPELQALRNWCRDQVCAQPAGSPPAQWPGAEVAAAEDVGDVPLPNFDPRLVLDAPVPMVAADDGNRIVAVNAHAAEVLGWTPEQLTGRRLITIVPPRLREAHVAGFTRHLLTGEARLIGRPVRLPALCRDGSEVDLEMTLETRSVPGGRLVFLATFAVAR